MTASAGERKASVPFLAVTALGVVYGDIGTSPLYALRECFFGSHAVPPSYDNVLGVLSLVVYSLLFIISVKYVVVVMRADNQGEGGILALTALISGEGTPRGSRALLVTLGLFGAALLYGDGMITPAITVLGAVEGLHTVTPALSPYVVPVSVAILTGIFAIQRYGTARVGAWYGPVMVGWFVTIAALGAAWVAKEPGVLWAIDPRHAGRFFLEHGWHGFMVLGAVFLVVTGGEALYADMGHFGRRPIRLAWFVVVLPALLLNYFGQGALLLRHGTAASQPFFEMAPTWFQVPLVVLSTAAAIIASQALISGAFSLTRQAIQLGYVPRVSVIHTSFTEAGQIYVPQVNVLLAVGTIIIVIGFGSSGALAAAYGVAVALTMVLTVVLLNVVARERWGWSPLLAAGVTGLFLVVDGAFFVANVTKVSHGGWLPLAIGCVLLVLMTTWKTGRRLVAERLLDRAMPFDALQASLLAHPPARVPGTVVYLTAQPDGAPRALVNNLRFNKTLHEHVIVLTIVTANVPHVDDANRISVRGIGSQITAIRAQFGFMDTPHVPPILALAQAAGVPIDSSDLTYCLGRETILSTRPGGMARWREQLFIWMVRNASRATTYFGLPADRVVELGVQVEV